MAPSFSSSSRVEGGALHLGHSGSFWRGGRVRGRRSPCQQPQRQRDDEDPVPFQESGREAAHFAGRLRGYGQVPCPYLGQCGLPIRGRSGVVQSIWHVQPHGAFVVRGELSVREGYMCSYIFHFVHLFLAGNELLCNVCVRHYNFVKLSLKAFSTICSN